MAYLNMFHENKRQYRHQVWFIPATLSIIINHYVYIFKLSRFLLMFVVFQPTTLREPRPPPLVATTTTTVPIGAGRPLHQRQPSPIHLPHHESFV